MRNTYTKPVFAVDTGLAEGVYSTSGSTGSLLVVLDNQYQDSASTPGKFRCLITNLGIEDVIHLTITFNTSISAVSFESGSASISGNTITLTFSGAGLSASYAIVQTTENIPTEFQIVDYHYSIN